jgi:outer membrane protein
MRIGGLLTLAIALSASGAARADTLADAIASAYEANPALLAERAGNRASDENFVAAKSAYGPTISANASHGYQRDRGFQSNPIFGVSPNRSTLGSGYSTSYGVTASQPIFTSGRLSSQVGVARSEVGFSRQTLRITESQVLLDVISSYVGVRRDQKLVAIAQENLDLLGRQLSDTQERFRVRETTATDLAQTENRYGFARAQLLEAQGQLEISEGGYLAVVGRLPRDLAPEPELRALPATIEQAYERAEQNNPTLLAAQFRERGSRAALAAARADRGPNISLQGSAFSESESPYNDRLRGDQIIGRAVVDLPLYAGGLLSARIREAMARNDQDLRLVEQARRETRQAVASAWDRLISTRGSLEPYAAAVKAAEEAFAGAREQERLGARATIDVLDQARDLLLSRSSYVQAQANEYVARAALLSAIGELEANQLFPSIPRYDPDRHFKRVQWQGGLPAGPVLKVVDSIFDPDLEKPAASRDPADSIRKEPNAPLGPAPAPEAAGAP